MFQPQGDPRGLVEGVSSQTKLWLGPYQIYSRLQMGWGIAQVLAPAVPPMSSVEVIAGRSTHLDNRRVNRFASWHHPHPRGMGCTPPCHFFRLCRCDLSSHRSVASWWSAVLPALLPCYSRVARTQPSESCLHVACPFLCEVEYPPDGP